MPLPTHEELIKDPFMREVLENFDAELTTWLTAEHDDEGHHTNISAIDLTLSDGATIHGDVLFTQGGAFADASLIGGQLLIDSIVSVTTGSAGNNVLAWTADPGSGGQIVIYDQNSFVVMLIGAGQAQIGDASALLPFVLHGSAEITGVITAAGLPTSAGAANTLWVDTAGGLNIVKRV